MKVLLKAPLFTGTQDMTRALTSQVLNISQVDNIGIQLTWTGSPTGVFAVQGSLDYTPNPGGGTPLVAGTFTTVPLASSTSTGGASGTLLINLNDIGFPWLQVIYTPTSGTGTLTVGQLFGKAI